MLPLLALPCRAPEEQEGTQHGACVLCPFLHRIACYTNLTAYTQIGHTNLRFVKPFLHRRCTQSTRLDLCDRFVKRTCCAPKGQVDARQLRGTHSILCLSFAHRSNRVRCALHTDCPYGARVWAIRSVKQK